jgi:hypothetical protein
LQQALASYSAAIGAGHKAKGDCLTLFRMSRTPEGITALEHMQTKYAHLSPEMRRELQKNFVFSIFMDADEETANRIVDAVEQLS